jgi:hypothetical protein
MDFHTVRMSEGWHPTALGLIFCWSLNPAKVDHAMAAFAHPGRGWAKGVL